MELVPAPGRQFKTASMILIILLGSADAIYLLLNTFGDLEILSKQAVLAINATIAFLIVPVRLIKQNIAATTDQKTAIVEFAAAAPMAPGEENVEVKIDNAIVPSVPVPAVPAN